jgi:hypothetical protein
MVSYRRYILHSPPGLENPKYLHRVYKLLKTLYGLKHGYVMGSVDKTLFTLKHDTDFLLVQIYVNDIILGDSSYTLVSRFQEMMENEF